MTKQELIELIENYLWRIIHANDCLQLYKTIITAKQTRLTEMNYAPAFFGIVERSVIDDMLMTTAKLFDDNSDTMSMKKLINICSQNKSCFLEESKIVYHWADDEEKEPYVETHVINVDDDIKKANDDLENLKPIISNLKTRRDKYYAHSDKKYVLAPSKLQVDAPLCFDDVESLLIFASNTCNKFLCNINQQGFVTQSSNINDLMILLDKLHDGNT